MPSGHNNEPSIFGLPATIKLDVLHAWVQVATFPAANCSFFVSFDQYLAVMILTRNSGCNASAVTGSLYVRYSGIQQLAPGVFAGMHSLLEL
jgi:hypothetical protein